MKILFLCKRYYTNKDLIGDRFGRLFHLPIQLSRLGATVSVVALDYRNVSSVSERIGDVTFRAVPTRLARMPRLLQELREFVRLFQPDIVIASGDSHIGLMGKRLAFSAHANFVFDVYDYYPAFVGNRIPGMRAMFHSTVRQADLVLCASHPLRARLSGKYQKALVVENGVDRELFGPKSKKAARGALGLADHAPTLGYFGSITPTRGPLLFAAVDRLTDEFPELRVLLSGKVSGVDIDRSFINYMGELPQSKVPTLIAACDVVTIPYASDPFNDMAGPCKIAEYLACQRPVIATRVAGHELAFNDVPESLCDPEPGDMARALRQQLESPRVAEFPSNLDWAEIARRLRDELTSLHPLV